MTAASKDGPLKFITPGGLVDFVDTTALDVELDPAKRVLTVPFRFTLGPAVEDSIERLLEAMPPDTKGTGFKITATAYLRFDNWPVIQVDTPLTIDVEDVEKPPRKPGVSQILRVPQFETAVENLDSMGSNR